MDPQAIILTVISIALSLTLGACADLFRRVRTLEDRQSRSEEREPAGREAIERLQAALDRMGDLYERSREDQVGYIRRLERMEDRLESVLKALESR